MLCLPDRGENTLRFWQHIDKDFEVEPVWSTLDRNECIHQLEIMTAELVLANALKA